MPDAPHTPKYRHHKPTGQAVVTLNGHDHYLGNYGTPASRRQYDRLVAEWLHHGRELPGRADDLTVAELVNRHRKHVESYYVKDGRQTDEVANFKSALRPLLKLYADLPARDFGPLALKVVRDQMIAAGWCRTFINRQIGRVKACFRWGVENEIVPPSLYHGLQAVRGLARGRTPGVVESEPVKPVPDAYVDAIRPHVSRQVWAMVELQRLTGMRSGEVITMTTGAIDTTGDIWEYRPGRHKTEHHGRQRIVPIGPQAQAVLREFLRPNLGALLFSPRDAERERHGKARTHRRPNQKPNRRKSGRRVREAYDAHSYGRAVARACKLAGIDGWHPHQLRHNYASAVRKRFGIEAARAALGHASAVVTELYAEIDLQKASLVAAEVG